MIFIDKRIKRLMFKINAGGDGDGDGGSGGSDSAAEAGNAAAAAGIGHAGSIGGGGHSGTGAPGGSVGGSSGGGGGGDIDAEIDAIDAAMAQSDAQAAENEAQTDNEFGGGDIDAEIDAIDAAMAQSDAQAAENEAQTDSDFGGGGDTGIFSSLRNLFSETIPDFAVSAVDTVVDKVFGEMAPGLGKTPGQIAGDEAAKLEFGLPGTIANEIDKDLSESTRGTQDELSLAVMEARYAETPEEKEKAMAQVDSLSSQLDYSDLKDFNVNMGLAGIPRAVDLAVKTKSPFGVKDIVTAAASVAAAAGVALGTDVVGDEPEQSEGDADSRTVGTTDVLQSLDPGGEDMADNTTDLLAQLRKQLSTGESADNISFKVGNQTISFMPKAKRDELELLIKYLALQQGESQFSRQLAQNEPSSIDKASQLIGLGSDAISVWKGISSFF